MTRPPEAQLVLLASRVSLDAIAAGEIKRLLQGKIDWSLVLQLAIPHGTLPLIARNLGEIDSGEVPADLLRQIGSYANRIRTRNEQAMAELGEVLRALNRDGIEAIPFKGCILQATVYGGIALREFYDIDLIVGPTYIAPAIQAMETLGYRLKPQQRRHMGEVLRKEHALEFTQADRVTVELHWRFCDTGFDVPLDSSLRAGHQTVSVGGLAIPAMSPQGTLLLLCAHQARHRWRRLNWLCDIAAFLNTYSGLDWSAALRHAREIRCERMVLTTLELTRLLLGVCLPGIVEQRLWQERRARELALRLAPTIPGGPHEPRSRRPFRRICEDVEMHEGNRVAVASRYLAGKARRRLGLKAAASAHDGF